MNNRHLLTNDCGMNGIYRCKLIELNGDIRAYIPGIHSISPYDENGNLIISNNKLNTFPKIQWCCYNIESKSVINDEPQWVMFENGDIKRPVVISYSTIGSGHKIGNLTHENVKVTVQPVSTEQPLSSNELIVPDGYGTVETYEKEMVNSNSNTHGWAIWDTNGDGVADEKDILSQGGLRLNAINNDRMKQGDIFGLTNCAIIDNRLMIATKQNIGGNFPVTLGNYLDVQFLDGSIWNCIVADFKGSDAPHAWGHNEGASVVEIIYWDNNNSGNQNKKVTKITKVGKYEIQ